MRRYLAFRILQALGVVAFVTTLSFVVVHLAPGDPISTTLQGSNVTEQTRQHWRVEYGLDRPIPEQYLRWLRLTARGDLGFSFSQRRPVRDVLADAMPRTLALTGLALVLSFALGIIVGLLQAERVNSPRDRWLGRVLLLMYSVPDFWLALMMLLFFSYRLRLFPPGGLHDAVMYDYMSATGKVIDAIKHLVLPVLTLTLLYTASIARIQRAELVSLTHSDWMRTAVAKGLGWTSAVRRHALRNALLPTITLLGVNLPALAVGAIFVERVFSWPGMGFVTVGAVGARDYPLVMAGVVVTSILVVCGALVADVAVSIADPRIRIR
ncbi:MAG: ABC transporter permease [bacterium]